ncbi:Gamma-tubulin complex component 2 [Physocladia obscura]|uniref:Gamma-tubulin complex component 2 n=1 Tax=Physocladia obscura TaxID=109957 RepID=A0AAD5T469_9FUNG|nr:Gamma-tubulin complex component 2 [Physocladia obscura]
MSDFRVEGLVSELLHTLGVEANAAECARVLRGGMEGKGKVNSINGAPNVNAGNGNGNSNSNSSTVSAFSIVSVVSHALAAPADATAILKRFEHLRREHVVDLGAWAALAAKIKTDPAITRLVRNNKQQQVGQQQQAAQQQQQQGMQSHITNKSMSASPTQLASTLGPLPSTPSPTTTATSIHGNYPTALSTSPLSASALASASANVNARGRTRPLAPAIITANAAQGLINARLKQDSAASFLNINTPKRVRSASVSLASPSADTIVNQISAMTSSPTISYVDPKSFLNSSTRRRSAILKKTSSSRLGVVEEDLSMSLNALQPPFACRLPKTPVSLNKNIKESTVDPINKLSIPEQENFILEDLLYVLLGIDGVYIKQSSFASNRREIQTLRTEFKIDPTLDLSLASMIKRILPIASDFLFINNFMDSHSRFEFGKVSHALVAGMRGILEDYFTLIAQLEHQIRFAPAFGLQKLWYHVLPTGHILSLVANLVTAIYDSEQASAEIFNPMNIRMASSSSSSTNCSILQAAAAPRGGGVILTILAEKVLTTAGDATAHKTYTHLLQRASVPYFSMLRTWINTGAISDDPYDEFLVAERRGRGVRKDGIGDDFNDVYWEQRYTIRNGPGEVPIFLEGVKEKILLAGKYLNVVCECGGDGGGGFYEGSSSGKENEDDLKKHVAAFGDIVRVVDDGRFVVEIERAYRYANKTLLDLLFKGNKLVDRLRSLKHYFLLDQSDFLTHFLDLAYPELHKPRDLVSVDRLSAMLELVLRTPGSVSYNDSYKDDITVELSSYSLVEQLLRVTAVVGVDYREVFVEADDGSTLVDMSKVNITGAGNQDDEIELRGIDAITLGYNSTFPISLIINKRVITKYQLLFRHLLHCKNVERMLTNVWALKTKFLRHRRVTVEMAKRAAMVPQKGKAPAATSALPTAGLSMKPPLRVPIAATTSEEDAKLKDEGLFLARISVVQGRMLNFVQQFLHFICFDVIEPSWALFERSLEKHFGNLMEVCTDFSIFATQFLLERFSATGIEERDDNESEPSSPLEDEPPQFADISPTSKAHKVLQRFEEQQILTMREFIFGLQFADSMNSFESLGVTVGSIVATPSASAASLVSAVLQDLVTRIDYNMFYSKVFVGGVGAAGVGILGKNRLSSGTGNSGGISGIAF